MVNVISMWKQGNTAFVKTNIYFIIESTGQSFSFWGLGIAEGNLQQMI